MHDPDQHRNKVSFDTTVGKLVHYNSIKLSNAQIGDLARGDHGSLRIDAQAERK